MEEKYSPEVVEKYCSVLINNYREINDILFSIGITKEELWKDEEYGSYYSYICSLHDKLRFFSKESIKLKLSLEKYHLKKISSEI